MKVSDLNRIIEETISEEIKKSILEESDKKKTAYCIKCEGEYIEICHTKEEAEKKCEEYNNNNPDKKYIIEVETYESKEELIDKLDEMSEKLDSENMEENQTISELNHDDQNENAFVLAADAARDKGEKEFEFPKGSGKMHPVTIKSDIDEEELEVHEELEEVECEKCGKGICECGSMEEGSCKKCGKELCECGDMYEEESINESNKKVLRLKESELVEMITKIVNESVPGLQAVENAHKVADKETKEHMANVDKKLKDNLSVEGNDNPEFPKAIGKGGPDTLDPKQAVHNTEDQHEEMESERGEHALDLDYDHEPTDKFKDRLKKALEGDSTMGNADGGNTIPTDTGKKLAATAEKRKDRYENQPMYKKDIQPVAVVSEEKEEITETTKEENNVLEEEIKRMKSISSYNEKTQ